MFENIFARIIVKNRYLKAVYHFWGMIIFSGRTYKNGIGGLRKNAEYFPEEDKIYCDNTNIMHALTERVNAGTVRETYFLNQIRSAGYMVQYPKQGDFLVNGKYLFEVGGRRKSFDQIKDIPDSFLAIDEEEIGRGSKIPLWMFGLLY